MSLTKEQREAVLNTIEKTSTNVREKRNYCDEFSHILDLTTREDIERTLDGHTYKLYVVRPKNLQKNAPIHINVHGGGFYIGHKENDWVYSSYLADKINCIIVDVDYTTTKEAPFPTSINQTYDAAKFVFENCEKWGGNKDRISMGGYSAGATITAAVTQMSIESQEFKFNLQVLGYPLLDSKINPMYKKDGYDRFMPFERELAFYSLYLENQDSLADTPLVSALYADDELLAKFPKTLIISAEHCNFRHENEEFAKRLASIGVDVTAKRFLGARHGFIPHFEEHWEEGATLITNYISNN